MEGIQFVVNERGEKTAVVIDLEENGALWEDFYDRALYLPEEWATDEARRQGVGVPEGVAFPTKPELAREVLERAFEAGVPRSWVTADTVYGSDRRLRRDLEARE